MTTPYLGIKARSLDVVLTADSAFVASLTRSDDDWQTGDEIHLIFDTGDDWQANLSGRLATWDKTDTEVNDLIAAEPVRVELWYTSPTAEPFRWTRGKVEVQG